MRNAWKGLIIGGLTGVGAGVILDVLSAGSEQLSTAGSRAARRFPAAAGKVKDAVISGVDRIGDADLPERAAEAAHRVVDSDLTDRARDMVSSALDKSLAAVGGLSAGAELGAAVAEPTRRAAHRVAHDTRQAASAVRGDHR